MEGAGWGGRSRGTEIGTQRIEGNGAEGSTPHSPEGCIADALARIVAALDALDYADHTRAAHLLSAAIQSLTAATAKLDPAKI